jgi:heat shock protein HtpX
LDDAELEGVIAHELAHIRNKDVRLLIISIIFVGIVGFIMQVAF